jgi:hypothetical protein
VEKSQSLMMRASLPVTTDAAHIRMMVPGSLMPGDEFSADEPRFTTQVAARIARTEPATVRSWGRKYGLLGWLEHEKRQAGVLWSVIDCMRLTLCATMIKQGIDPADAAWRVGTLATPQKLARDTVAAFVALIENRTLPGLVICHAGGTEKYQTHRASFHMFDPAESIGAVYERVRTASHRREFVLFDLRDIIEHVETELAIERVSK